MKKRRTRIESPGFTLTEIMIALALVSLLLVGISRIFAMTSTTIGKGNALSTSMRSQSAVGQMMLADFYGPGKPGDELENYGIVPLKNRVDADQSMPMLTISNFRTPAYMSEKEQAADVNAPTEAMTTFAQRSPLIRGVDRNNDGTDNDPGEITPIYAYGGRNFRSDTFSFFSSGKFRSQSGAGLGTNMMSGAEGRDAWIWYGHLRTFAGNLTKLDRADGYGAPGEWLTPVRDGDYQSFFTGTPIPNVNNRYATQWMLGRVQQLMVGTTDHDANVVTSKTVVANNDPSAPLFFTSRNWETPNDFSNSRTATPIQLDASVRYYWPTQPSSTADFNQYNRAVNTSDVPAGTAPFYQARNVRTDVAGATMKEFRQRVREVQQYDADAVLTDGQYNDNGQITYTNSSQEWWRFMPVGFNQRFNINPFPASATSVRGAAQRQQLVTAGCTQFIVEYAGDFCTQQDDGSVNAGTDSFTPDGIIDYVSIRNGSRWDHQTRWYGLPRDVDGDGVIIGNASADERPTEAPQTGPSATPQYTSAIVPPPNSGSGLWHSPDVVPLRDVTGRISSFEKILPPAAADYLQVINEPTSSQNRNRSLDAATNPEHSGYVCVWGTREFEETAVRAPSLIRVTVDVMDANNRMDEPVTQEYVLPVSRSN